MEKLVSIIVPCRNEENYIGPLIESVLNQDYPSEKIELLIMDGMSDDNTRNIVTQYSNNHSFIQLIDNPKKYVPFALNKGIQSSKGEIIIILGAHSVYPDYYVSRLVNWLNKLNADNVGGLWITNPGSDTLKAKAIALAQSNAFGVGNALYKIGTSEVQEADTVPFGCYKREVFDKIGFFDEDLIRNQDDELNARLKNSEGKMFLVPDVEINYYARDTYTKLWTMHYQYGYFKPLVNIKLGKPATWRQFVPFLFVTSLICSLALYPFHSYSLYIFLLIISLHSIANFIASFKISLPKIAMIPFLFLAFLTMHISYGWGYLIGIINFWILKNHTTPKEVKMSR
ncbi:MAG: glycosyltransferase family 2 protein [Bacteroidia bacterium]|nr:glycosyltransferase family 2 protein [Bacteroidia bacterium]